MHSFRHRPNIMTCDDSEQSCQTTEVLPDQPENASMTTENTASSQAGTSAENEGNVDPGVTMSNIMSPPTGKFHMNRCQVTVT